MGLRDRLRRLVQPPPTPAPSVAAPRLRPPRLPREVTAPPAGALLVDVSRPVDTRALAAGGRALVVVGGPFAAGMAERLSALGADDVAWMAS